MPVRRRISNQDINSSIQIYVEHSVHELVDRYHLKGNDARKVVVIFNALALLPDVHEVGKAFTTFRQAKNPGQLMVALEVFQYAFESAVQQGADRVDSVRIALAVSGAVMSLGSYASLDRVMSLLSRRVSLQSLIDKIRKMAIGEQRRESREAVSGQRGRPLVSSGGRGPGSSTTAQIAKAIRDELSQSEHGRAALDYIAPVNFTDHETVTLFRAVGGDIGRFATACLNDNARSIINRYLRDPRHQMPQDPNLTEVLR